MKFTEILLSNAYILSIKHIKKTIIYLLKRLMYVNLYKISKINQCTSKYTRYFKENDKYERKKICKI